MKPSILSLLFLIVFNYSQLFSQCSLTAICSGGNWSAASTWAHSACGGLTMPDDNMSIIIPACSTVFVDINSPIYTGMSIYVYGTLYFNVGQKINLSANGFVQIFSGGMLDGGNGGSKITIDGSSVWVGPGPDPGPLTFGSSPLPIELLDFNALQKNSNVNLFWSTASELNNDFYTIQRSVDGLNFEEIAVVDGAGNSNTLLDYLFSDNSPLLGVSYYRLKQTDFNGNYSFSKMEKIECSNPLFSFEVFPNPADGTTVNITFNSVFNAEVEVVVTDMMGRECYSKIIYLQKNHKNSFALDSFMNLVKGAYLVSASSMNNIQNKVLIIN